MTDIVNLRRIRKAKARKDAAQVAAQNRARHGQTKSARTRADIAAQQRERLLDQARLETDEPASGTS